MRPEYNPGAFVRIKPQSSPRMTQQRRPIVVVIVLGLFFLAGLVTVLLGGQGLEPGSGNPPADSGQTVLIVGVDNLAAAQPKLVAVWLATFSAENRDVLLYGQPIDAPVCGSSPTTLQELFLWQPQSGLSPAFLEALGAAGPDAVVVADETAFIALIDELHGLDLNGAKLEGDQVVAVLRTLYQNPAGLLTTQEQFLIALARRATESASQVDLNRLTELIPGHAYTSVPPLDLITLYLPLQPLGPSSILVFASKNPAVPCPG
ncbi:MAG: hypothetical protein ACRDHG_06680 [Anaerolineales bacterium]